MNNSEMLETNTKILHVFEKYLDKVDDVNVFVAHTKFVGFYLANNPCYQLYSERIEKRIKIFQSNLPTHETKTNSGKVLHVATQIYLTGGHTRVLENWINFRQETNHDVVLISQFRKYKLNIPSKSKIFELNNELNSAMKIAYLNELYCHYDEVIFHVHPHDVIPLIAMGRHAVRKFKFYNHADHIFNFGPSLAGIVYDMSSKGSQFTLSFRGATASKVIPFPLDVDGEGSSQVTKNENREQLEIPRDSKVVLTIGTEYKYLPNSNFNLFQVFSSLAFENPHYLFIFIGPDATFKKYCNGQSENIRLLGRVSKDVVYRYYKACDLYVDSLPIGGGIALIEAILFDLPIITFDNGFNAFDAAAKFRRPYENLQQDIKMLLDDDQKRQKLKSDCYLEALKHQKKNWNNNFNNQEIKPNDSAMLGPSELKKYCENLISKYMPFSIPRVDYELSNSVLLDLTKLMPLITIIKILMFQLVSPFVLPFLSKFLDRGARGQALLRGSVK